MARGEWGPGQHADRWARTALLRRLCAWAGGGEVGLAAGRKQPATAGGYGSKRAAHMDAFLHTYLQTFLFLRTYPPDSPLTCTYLACTQRGGGQKAEKTSRFAEIPISRCADQHLVRRRSVSRTISEGGRAPRSRVAVRPRRRHCDRA
eukprot:2550130-Pleurochrysis_carterae.AAC.1